MKTIGIDARYLLRPLRGMPLYVNRLCQLLPEIRPDYNFCYFINKGFEHNDSSSNYQSRLDDLMSHVNVKIINYDSDAELMWEQFHLPRLLKKNKVDLLHMPGSRICFFPGIPVVATLHDVIEFKVFNREYIRGFISNLSNFRMFCYAARISAYVWTNYRYGFSRAAHIITVSKYSATDIIETLGIPSSKLTAIHHGLDDEFILGDTGYKDQSSRHYVLMLGGDSPHKNPEGAISAWAKVPESTRRKYPLKIIGFCGNNESPLLNALREHGLQNEVEIIGWVTQDQLVNYLRSAALFIYFSRYEGFGFPPLHAMASGTPVIASNCTSIPEVLGDVGFKYSPDDHNGAARGIQQILNDPSLWHQQSTAGVSRAMSFSWRESAIQHLNVYVMVMERYYGSSF